MHCFSPHMLTNPEYSVSWLLNREKVQQQMFWCSSCYRLWAAPLFFCSFEQLDVSMCHDQSDFFYLNWPFDVPFEKLLFNECRRGSKQKTFSLFLTYLLNWSMIKNKQNWNCNFMMGLLISFENKWDKNHSNGKNILPNGKHWLEKLPSRRLVIAQVGCSLLVKLF